MNRSTFRVLFYANGSKEKNGIVPLMGRLTINGTVAQFSCKQTVPKELWDAKANKAKGKSKESRDVNLTLDNIKAQIIKHYQYISDRDAYVTADMVRNAFQGMGNGQETLLKVFDKDCATLLKRVGKDRSILTYKVMMRARNNVSAFIQWYYRRADMSMLELTPDFIKAFSAYLIVDRNLKNSTIWVNCAWLKGVVYRAHLDGLIPRNPFAQFRISLNTKDREYLTENDLKILMAHSFKRATLAFARDLFVFACFTALSFVDIKQLNINHIVEVNGEKWIVSKRQKTNVPFQVKLLDIPLQILERYSHLREGNLVFGEINYWAICKQLKRVIRDCGIEKTISFHCSRHTFGTLALSKGMPIESVSRILGHTNIVTTQIYAKITTQKLDNDLTMFGDKVNRAFNDAKEP